MADTKFGKYVIESLTRSMYDDSRCIYREYVQNAADQIDKAIEENIEEDGYYAIYIDIDRDARRIVIEDTATGVKKEETQQLRDVACSQKKRGKNKGFRGIGRLGGLGYCNTLIFETSYKGQEEKTIMTWDAAKMNTIVDDEMDDSEAGDVVDQCVKYDYKPEIKEKHYFKVILEGVTEDVLLNEHEIRDYLRMVAPVDYPTSFNRFGSQIKLYAKEHGLSIDTYNVFLNDDQVYKGYAPSIKDKKNGDYEMTDIKFFSRKDKDDNYIYWGWYSISELRGQIPDYNLAYGIRLRSENIQLGDSRTCRNFFTSEGDKRFAMYFYGELFVVSPLLIPDARRDYIRADNNGYRSNFENLVTSDFLELKNLCQDASDLRSAAKKVATAAAGQQKISKKKEEGFTSQIEAAKSQEDFEQHKKNQEKYAKQFANIKKRLEDNQSPLGFMAPIFEEATPELVNMQQTKTDVVDQTQKMPPSSNTVQEVTMVSEDAPSKLRTDGQLYKKFGAKEKKIINAVYDTIFLYFPDEGMRESLINRIEKEITK